MFFNTHAFVAEKTYNSKSNLLVIGSILPDIAITKIIGWEEGLHGVENANKFAGFLIKNNPSLKDLGKGVLSHCVLDDYSHIDYNGKAGYAYQNNKELVKLVKKFYKIDRKSAEVKAHNYIESAVDILLLKKNPNIENEIKKSINELDKPQTIKTVSKYFKIKNNKLEVAMETYFNLMIKNNLSNITGWLTFWEDLEEAMNLRKITDQQKMELLNLSISIVAPSYEEFINFAINT